MLKNEINLRLMNKSEEEDIKEENIKEENYPLTEKLLKNII